MELGTAVFLSSITLCAVLLYGFTKDRWSWWRVIFRTFIGMVVLAVIGVALIVVSQNWGQIFPTKLTRQTGYAGVSLGMSRDEVRYIKGRPSHIHSNDIDVGIFGKLKLSELPQGKTAYDFPAWSYDGVYFDFGEGNTVLKIACSSLDQIYPCPEIGGVQEGTSEAELVRKLGKSSGSKMNDIGMKFLGYNDIGVEFVLEKEKVSRLQVGRPNF